MVMTSILHALHTVIDLGILTLIVLLKGGSEGDIWKIVGCMPPRYINFICISCEMFVFIKIAFSYK